MTLAFLLIAAALTIGTVLLLVIPLLGRTHESGGTDREKRLAVYRQQLIELQQDLSYHLLTPEQFQLSRQELERRVLEEAGSLASADPGSVRPRPGKKVALALLVAMPPAAFLLYWTLGDPKALLHPPLEPGARENSEYAHQTSGGLEAMTERLKRKLAQNPGDGAGWALLARSYVELDRHADAVPAFERALRATPDDPQLLVDYADALGMVHGRTLEGKPEELVDKALALDPHNVKGLLLAGTIAYDRKAFRTALRYWEQAQRELAPEAEPEVVQELTSNIAEIREILAQGPASSPGAKAASAARLGPSPAPLSISGTVTLSPALVAKRSASDVLFVFARSVEGPPMPVAIVRATAKDLPFAFRLDDSTSPMPTRKLSEAGPVVIVARLSRSGEATPKSGDLQGVSKPVKPGAQDLQIVIDSELP